MMENRDPSSNHETKFRMKVAIDNGMSDLNIRANVVLAKEAKATDKSKIYIWKMIYLELMAVHITFLIPSF